MEACDQPSNAHHTSILGFIRVAWDLVLALEILTSTRDLSFTSHPEDLYHRIIAFHPPFDMLWNIDPYIAHALQNQTSS